MDINQPMQRMLQPDERITVTLTAQQWNEVLRVMDEAPIAHRVVNPLMMMIRQQCMSMTMEPVQ